VALHAQTAPDTATTEAITTGGIGTGPRLQESDEEAREEALIEEPRKKR
jgi:hypothetical protein